MRLAQICAFEILHLTVFALSVPAGCANHTTLHLHFRFAFVGEIYHFRYFTKRDVIFVSPTVVNNKFEEIQASLLV